MTRKFIEDVFSKIPEGVETGVFGCYGSSKGDTEICVRCDGDWCTVAFTYGNGGEKLVEDFDDVVARAVASAGKDVKTDGGQSVTDRDSELLKACDELAKAVRERDQFKSHEWNEVFLKDCNGASLWLGDRKLMDGVLALCAEPFDRKVEEAKDALELVGTKVFKKRQRQ